MNMIQKLKLLSKKQKKELALTIGLGTLVFVLFMIMGILSGWK